MAAIMDPCSPGTESRLQSFRSEGAVSDLTTGKRQKTEEKASDISLGPGFINWSRRMLMRAGSGFVICIRLYSHVCGR